MSLNNEDKKEVGPTKNFKYLDDLIRSGLKEIILDSDIILSDTEEEQFPEGLKLFDDNLLIDGNGHTIDACGKTRIFACTGKNITLKNLTLKNGFAKEKGGAIINMGILTIIESVLTKNIACGDNDGGGAIYNEKGEITIIKSVLSENTAKNRSGGAIRNNAKLNVKKSTFKDNSSKIGGGAVANDCEMSLKESVLTHNSADFGGAIGNARLLNVSNSSFSKNTANRLGGAVNNNGKLDVEKSEFANNASKNLGGAVNNNKGDVTIKNSGFVENTSKLGGAIHNMMNLTIAHSSFIKNDAYIGGALHNRNKLSIVESKFHENIAKDSGGAINNKNGDLDIVKSDLGENTAGTYGGAINNNARLYISESLMVKNKARWGGAINNTDKADIIKSSINENTANEFGGAINNNSGINISQSLICKNMAFESGAIHHTKGNFKIFDCEISNNESSNSIVLNNDYLQVYNTLFNHNHSKHVISNEGHESNLAIFYGEFMENTVDAVLLNCGKFSTIEKTLFKNYPSSLNILNNTDLTLISPKINDNGKTILNKGDILIRKSSPGLEDKIQGGGTVETLGTIPSEPKFNFEYLDKKIHNSKSRKIFLDKDISFDNYERDYYEGGIDLDVDGLIIDGRGRTIDAHDKTRIFIVTGQNITLKNIVFKNGHSHKNYDNVENSNGGAIKSTHNSNLKIIHCKFIDNTSEDCGGAIQNKGEMSISNSSLEGNATKEAGGAIANSGDLSLIRSTLAQNLADDGGAIHNNGDLTLVRCRIIENTAKDGSGGAIENMSKLTITKSLLSRNTAKVGSGGLIYSDGGELTIEKSSLVKNTAGFHGGAIYNNDTKVKITESKIIKNTAKWDGGSIRNSGELKISKSVFKKNSAQEGSGGAIYNFESELNISKSEITQNTAKNDDGAIFSYNCEYELKDSVVENNDVTGEDE